MSLRSPLGIVLGHGSGHNAVHHWWVQRMTALALLPLTVWLLSGLIRLPLTDFATVTAWIAPGWNPVLLSLLVLVMCWHSRLGIEVVVEDYVHGYAAKTLRAGALEALRTCCWPPPACTRCCTLRCGVK